MSADAVGGVWDYALDLARELGRSGMEVVLVVLGPRATETQRRQARAISTLELREVEGRLEWMDEPWADVDRTAALLREEAARLQVELVHSNGYALGAAGFSVPVVVVAHSSVLGWWRAVRGQSAPARWDTYRARMIAGLRAADHVVAPTRAMLDELVAEVGALPSASVIPNGREIREWSARGPKRDLVLGVGRLWDEAKNVALLGEVAPRLPWPVWVAGESRPAFPRSAHPPQGRGLVELGRLDRRALRGVYARATIYAHPALYEPFGLSVLEAALAGSALVLGDIPSLREIWEGAARFVDPRDADSLAATLLELIADPETRQGLAARAERRAQGFTAARMAAAYLDLYRGVASRAIGKEGTACAS